MQATRAMMLLGAILTASAGCALDPFEPTVRDAARDATVAADAGRGDAGRGDAGRGDAGRGDAGRHDAGRDAAIADAAMMIDASCVGPELCNGVDDDCNPATADGAGEPTLGDACDGADTDMCADGVYHCAAATLECTDDTEASDETCNAIDDDCDGLIDEAGCPCSVRRIGARTYAFCAVTRLPWATAREACMTSGYDLVTIEDAAENAALTAEALTLGSEDWSIGLNDRLSEGTFEWSSGSTAAYRNWAADQPSNNIGQDCTLLVDGSGGSAPGSWNDFHCSQDAYFICEVP